MRIGIGLGVVDQAPLPFNPVRLFRSSDAGAFYDVSDLASMYQDSAGTTAAAVNSPVGLLLDKRYGLARGAELVSNGEFDNGTTGWTTAGSSIETLDVSGGIATLTATTTGSALLVGSHATTAGKTYEVTVTIIEETFTPSISFYVGVAGTQYGPTLAVGTRTFIFTAAASGTQISIGTGASANAGELIRIASISMREIPGNHAIQATSAARPMLRQDAGGRNYLDFDNLDDRLIATVTGLALPWDRVSAFRMQSWASSDRVFAQSAGATAGLLYQTNVTPQLALNDGAAAAANNGGLALGVAGVVTERHDNANSRLAINTGAYFTGTSGSSVPPGVSIGAHNDGTLASDLEFYGLVMIGRALTDAETTQTRAYFATRAGVNL